MERQKIKQIKDFPKQYGWLVDKSQGNLTQGSHKKVEWKCDKCGYVWAAKVMSVIKNGTGCPKCAGHVVTIGEDDLWTTHPDVAKLLVDPELGYKLKAKSNKKVDWKCDKCGQVWQAQVVSVVSSNNGGSNGCPVCANKKIVIGINDLWTTYPAVAEMLVDKEVGYEVCSGSSKQVEYVNKNGKVRQARVKNLVISWKNNNCVEDDREVKDRKCLWETHPDIAKMLVEPELGYKLVAGSERVVDWQCETGHKWSAKVVNVVRGNRCPICSNRKVVKGINDLWTTHPDIAAKLFDRSQGYELTHGSCQIVKWKCDVCHQTWDAKVYRVSRGSKCPVCDNKKIVKGINDLWTTNPDIADKLFDRSQGYEVGSGSCKKVKWLCDRCGCMNETQVKALVQGKGCPVCANQKIVKGINDLWTTQPNVARLLADKELGYKIGAGSNRKVDWKCDKCGHTWQAIVQDVVLGGGNCPVCINRCVKKGVNDLWTTHPEVASKLVDKDLGYQFTFSSNRKVKCKCDKCGNEWGSFLRNLTVGGTDCPVCTHIHTSRAEIELKEYIESLGFNVEQHNRDILDGREVDIYVPDKKIAFEYNGLFWHSDEQLHDIHYHEKKFLDCEKKGVQLITIWEDDWIHHRHVVEDMVRYKLGKTDGKRIYARKCSVDVIDAKTAADFLDENHIQGKVASTYHFGLFCDGELVAVLSCRSPKHNARMKRKDGEWEIQRYATKGSVVGGFSKLMKYAEKYIDGIKSWISFSSNDVSNGKMYLACGFKLDKELGADYKYFGAYTNNIRLPKESFQKKKFKNKSGLLFEEDLTERELAHLNELYRIHDCGKRRWTKDVCVL